MIVGASYSPLTPITEALTEKQTRAQLQEAEAEELKRLNGGVVPKGRKSSQTVFVTLGLRLIGIQWVHMFYLRCMHG